MLDKRLTPKEEQALRLNDIYYIHEIFNNIEDCITFINKKDNIPLDKIRNEFREEKLYFFIEDIDDYYSVYDEYIVFKTGRVARIEYY